MKAKKVMLDDREYVLVPRADYLRLVHGEDVEEAIPAMKAEIGASLRRAREHGGFTQEALAKKLKKSQAMVSAAESGRMSVGERYVLAVLKACGLPADWSGEASKKRR